MGLRKQITLLAIRACSDLFGVVIGWILAYLIRFHTYFEAPKGVPDWSLYFRLLPFIVVIWASVFLISGFYFRSTRRRSAFLEALDIIQCCVIAGFAFIAFTYFYAEYRYSRFTIGVFAIINPTLIILGRSLVRKALRIYRRKTPARGILIIGGGPLLHEAMTIARESEVEQAKIVGVYPVGDDHLRDQTSNFCKAHGLNLFLENVSEWTDFFSKHFIQTVIIALPHQSYRFIEENLQEITLQVADVKVVPDLLKLSRFGTGLDMVQGVPVINIHESPLEGFGGIIKRIFDIVFGLVALLIFLLPMLVIAFAIKLTSPGSIIFRQERMGLDGRIFYCLKFRSMPVDVENKSGPVWAKAGEARATPLGKILRKFSLDELPQLFNVLAGDMSLVGPRPERPVFVQKFRKMIPGYMLRHKAKAGITGWAQVNGWRGDTSIEKRIEYDLYYIQHWSLWLDIKILFKTTLEVFFSRNAY